MAYFPFRNIGLKFLSICIAALLWLVVAGDRVVERALRAPIEFQNLPQGLEIVGDPPEDVDVRLRGPSGTLGRLAPGDLSAVIDLRSARPGRRLFHLTSAQVRVPYGLDVVQVAPATLPMAFENSAIRIVKVQPSLDGSPAPGYEVVGVTSDPATIEVVGPEGALRGDFGRQRDPAPARGRHDRCRRSQRSAADAADGDRHRPDRAWHDDADVQGCTGERAESG
jgi:YbbR domain-containing protein